MKDENHSVETLAKGIIYTLGLGFASVAYYLQELAGGDPVVGLLPFIVPAALVVVDVVERDRPEGSGFPEESRL